METNATTPSPSTMPITSTDGMPPDIEKDDIIRKSIPRELPCKLTDEEFVRISRTRVAREAERNELAEELARETKKRKEQIESFDDEIEKMGRELHTGYQDRTIKCIEVFKKGVDGIGYVHTLRTDSWKEVERRPASAHETQRHLKVVEDQPSGILDEGRKRQRSAQAEKPSSDVPAADAVPSDVPAETPSSEAAPTDEGDASKPSKRGKKTEH